MDSATWKASATAVAADLIFLIHLIFCMFVLFGWTCDGNWQIFYACSLGIEITLLLLKFPCPLTLLESKLRRIANPNVTYDDPYIAYYGSKLMAVVGINISSSQRQVISAVVLLCLIALFFIQVGLFAILAVH